MGDVFGSNGIMNIDQSQPLVKNPDGSYTYRTTDGGSGIAREGDRTGIVESFSDLGKNLIGGVTGLAKSPGYDTAAAGAKEAQAYLQQLSQTAWDRQMQGLQGALGSFGSYDALASQMNPRHGGPAQGAAGGSGAGGPPGAPPPALPPPGTPTTGYRPPANQAPHNAPPVLPPPGAPSTGYSPPPIQPNHVSPYAPPSLPPPGSYAPPALPPPGAPPSLPPSGGFAPPALPPPGSPIGAPPSLSQPGIMDILAAMTTGRSGAGHF